MFAVLLLSLCTLLSSSAPAAIPSDVAIADTAALRVMSFNLRLHVASDSADAWPHRRDGVARLIRRYGPDVFGVQEAQRPMLGDLSERLPAYEWIGVGRTPGDSATEYSALLYRPDRLELLQHDTFWLSETPEEPGSQGWDAAYPRIATWGCFRDRATGQVFVAANTHLDHVGETARLESARLLRQRLARVADGAPVILTGDFNATPTSAPYHHLADADAPGLLLHDTYATARSGHHGPNATWNGFDAIEPGRRIDYVFTAGAVDVLRLRILADRLPSGRFPSDHLPVLATVSWRP